jgi:hypothetical protein
MVKAGKIEGWKVSKTSEKAGVQGSRIQGFEGAEGRSLVRHPVLCLFPMYEVRCTMYGFEG